MKTESKVCWILVLGAAGALGQGLPRATAQYGAFGLPDESGTRLICVRGMPQAARVRTAMCSDGSRVAVRFERGQAARGGDDGRQVPSRFDGMAGDVFRIVRGKVGLALSCFLANGWTSRATALPMQAAGKGVACGGELEGRIAALKGREVVRCFSLGQLPAGRRVVLAEFARMGKGALASVVLTDGERVMSADYPAEFRGEGEDLWRADDGGVLSPNGFEVVFVVRRGDKYGIGVSWAGTEGRSLQMFVSVGGKGFTRVIEDYWYQMPE
jgi:hypothetical protein